MKQSQRGFALLIAVIFMSVMLAFGLALGSLSYKQQVLASSSVQSQYAFYAADAGLECALYADQGSSSGSLFAHPGTVEQPPSAPVMTCDGISAISSNIASYDVDQWFVITERLSLDSDTATSRCADITVYKPNPNNNPADLPHYIFSQGYDVSCDVVANTDTDKARFVVRGISVRY